MNENSVMVLALCLIVCFLNVFPLTYSLKNKDKPCKQFSACKCIFPTGSGLNLNPINQILSVAVNSENNTNIHMRLCENASFGPDNSTNQCFHNVSICFVDENRNLSLSLGKIENMTFISQSQFEPISIHFENQDNKTNIALKCNEEATEPKLLFKSNQGYSVFNLELESRFACVHPFLAEEGPSGGLSTGSVLVIMLMVFTLVYFGGGMLTLKILRGAEGREMIPNIDFWTDLPYLVRDGVLFAMNGFRPATTYDRI